MSHGDPNYPGNIPIKKDEMKVLENKPATRDIINATRQIVTQREFNVGDTLIAINIADKKNPNSPYLDSNNKPQKFVVFHKDEIGLLYTRKINSDGRLGKAIELPCTWDYSTYRFIQDPEAAEAVILGTEDQYDPFKETKKFKSLKDKISRFNRKIRIIFDDENQVLSWARQLSVGTPIWSMDYGGIQQFTFEGVGANREIQLKSSQGSVTSVQLYRFTSRYYEYYNSKPRSFKEESKDV